jgi:hypothetical protein
MVREWVRAGRKEEVERFVAGFKGDPEEEGGEGGKEGGVEWERKRLAREFAGRMRDTCVAVLEKMREAEGRANEGGREGGKEGGREKSKVKTGDP